MDGRRKEKDSGCHDDQLLAKIGGGGEETDMGEGKGRHSPTGDKLFTCIGPFQVSDCV